MNSTTTINLVVTPEAEDYLERWELRSHFEGIVDYLRSNVPGVERLEAFVQPPFDAGGDEVVLLRVERPVTPEDDQLMKLTRWRIDTMPTPIRSRLIVLPF